MKLSQARFAFTLLAVTVAASGCGIVNNIRAKNQLNEGAAAYKAGRFAEAQKHFESAHELDPSQQNAPLFIARAIHAQYRPGVDTPENVAKAQAAIEAYKKVLEGSPNDVNADNAYNSVAYLYRQLKEEQKEEEWLTARANLSSAPTEKRSDAYTVLASKQWNCSYDITEQKENKETIDKADAVIVQYKKPKEQADFDKARNCTMKGLELANKAIELNANNPSAWSYKTNLLREMAKFSQMENKPEDKAKYDKEADEAEAIQKKLNEEAKRRKEEEEAKKSPTPAG